MKSLPQQTLVLSLLVTSLLACVVDAAITMPSLDPAIPDSLQWPSDYKHKGGKQESLGFRRAMGVVLDAQEGIYPIFVSQTKKGIIPNDVLTVGDIVVAVNGKPLGTNPTSQLRDALGEGRENAGYVWVTRWRKGNITRELINLGTKPLDLTQGGVPDGTRDWRLGPIGANGWCFHRRSRQGASTDARQLYITAVDTDGPAHGKLLVKDVILGAAGKPFSFDARKALAAAIDEAEKDENEGALELLVWRDGKNMTVTISLPVMGSYSKTAPFDCPKTDKIIDQAVAHILQNKDTLLEPKGWINYLNGLGLMATGREDVMPFVKEMAYGSILKEGETLSVEKHVSMMCWWWSYKTLFLTEYYLRTKDEAVLPTIEEYATKIAMGQSGAGTWGHTYAARENTGYLHGHLGGYGAINQQGLTLMIVLPLAAKCGVQNQEVMRAINRGNEFFRYFIGKGTIPYGDHGPANEWFDDNGKSGAAAIFFDLMDNSEGTEFFSEMVLGSTPNGREAGHTGHFWSHLWGGMGAARGGDKGLQVFMDVMNPIFTLERQPAGRFAFQDNAGGNGPKGDPKTKWDCTGTRLLQLCIPRRQLYITGKETPRKTHLTERRIAQLLAAGKLDGSKELRGELSVSHILGLLADPLPPIRSIGARTLAERELDIVDQLIPLLGGDNKYARYGAAEALCKAGFGSQKAADTLISLMASSEDLLFKRYAIDALINRDSKRGLLSVAKPAIPVLLKLAVEYSPDDPRKVLQQRIALALFYNGNAQPRRGLIPEYGLDGVDRDLLIPAIREILTNQNGGARSLAGWVLAKLSPNELEQLWPDVYQATHYIAPSGIMFAPGIRTTGLSIMADHHIEEGLDLAVWYIRHQKGHGASGRVPAALDAIRKYGSYAKRVIPELEKHYSYWESKRNPRKPISKDDPANLIRALIEEIQKMPPATFELVSIADEIRNLENPYEQAQANQ